MAKYMVLYNSTASASELMAKASPEEMKASMDEWMKWKDEATKSVKFEWGLPLQITTRLTPTGPTTSDSPVSGYAIMEGEKEAVLDALATHPNLKREGASIDVLEMISMPGM
ncbi:MAG: hypothetical protein ABI758_04380 [Candidatus Woesebacteria bacterium]